MSWRRRRGTSRDHRRRRLRSQRAGRDRDAGSLFYVNGSHAQAVNDRWAYKLSAGYFTQDPLPRPIGTIHERVRTRRIRRYANTGTSQPKFDARADYDIDATAAG